MIRIHAFQMISKTLTDLTYTYPFNVQNTRLRHTQYLSCFLTWRWSGKKFL